MLEWSSQSPVLNSIENLWQDSKLSVNQLSPPSLKYLANRNEEKHSGLQLDDLTETYQKAVQLYTFCDVCAFRYISQSINNTHI